MQSPMHPIEPIMPSANSSRRYQRGSVGLRGKHQVWVGRYHEDEIGLDGRVSRKYRRVVLGSKRDFPAKHLAQRQLDILLAPINATTYRPLIPITLEEFSVRWRFEVMSKRKPSGIHHAETHLRHQIIPYLGHLRLDQIGVEVQQIFVTRISATLCRKSVLNILSTLSSILRTADNWGYTCQRVCLRKLAIPHQEVKNPVRVFTAEQAREIVAATSGQFRLMFTIAAMTGLRAGEILGLQDGDFGVVPRRLTVRRSAWRGRVQTAKSPASQTCIAIPAALAEIIVAYLRICPPN